MPSRTSSADRSARPTRRLGRRRRLLCAGPLVAGVDEAGRGPLAGDSKLLTALQRERLFDEIRAKALCVSIAEASVEEIDRLNILQATLLAMRRAVAGLRLTPVKVLVDGNCPPELPVPCETVVQGDGRVQAIAAASILAKVARDRICSEHHERHPQYGFASHKGYATPEHMAALRAHGPCVWHRHSFAPVREQALARAQMWVPGLEVPPASPGTEAT
jgi:ribonuclease HII